MLCRALSVEFGSAGERMSLQLCLGEIADVVRIIAKKLSVSASCYIDSSSGLLKFPIQGHLIFTQPVGCFFVQLAVKLRRFPPFIFSLCSCST